MKEKLVGNLLYGQGGGPTSVINASAYGLFKEAFKHLEIENVYTANYGLLGILNDDLFKIENTKELEKLKATPGAAFGSSRIKLDLINEEDKFEKILEVFKKHNIRYFFYNGGNDSMDTTNKIGKYLKEHHYEINMITVEDPVEQKIFGAHQMPVVNTMNEEQREEKYTEALAAALRSDPDTLMVGEIRTLAAAQLTVRGALSGHNVWTTLHANSAMAALTRLLDLGIEAFKLKEETLMRGLVSMRLFKKLCPYCRERLIDHPENPAYRRVMDTFGELGLRQVYIRGAGCEECKGTGTLGRVKAGEIIITNSEFLRLALAGNTDAAYKYWLEEMDGRTLKEAATSLMLQGVIGVDELERWVGLLDRPGVY